MDQVSTGSQAGGAQDRHVVQPSPVPDNLNIDLVPTVYRNLTDMDQVPVGSQIGRVQGRQVVHPLPTPDNLGRSISVCADENSVPPNKARIIFMLMTFGFILMTQIVNTLIPYFFMSRTMFYTLDWKRNESYCNFIMDKDYGNKDLRFFFYEKKYCESLFLCFLF